MKLTEELRQCLVNFGLFDTAEETVRRMDVLRRINGLVKQWVRDTTLAKHMPEDVADSVGGKVFAFGSYRLGVHTRGGR